MGSLLCIRTLGWVSLQFWLAKPLFGNIGDKPEKKKVNELESIENKEKLNPFLSIDYLLIFIFVISALIFIVNDPLSKIGNIDTFNFTIFGMQDSLFYALLAVITFFIILIIIFLFDEVV